MLRSLVSKMKDKNPKTTDHGTPKNLEAELAAAAVAEGLKTPAPEASALKNIGLSAKKELNDTESFHKYIYGAVIVYHEWDGDDNLYKTIQDYLGYIGLKNEKCFIRMIDFPLLLPR